MKTKKATEKTMVQKNSTKNNEDPSQVSAQMYSDKIAQSVGIENERIEAILSARAHELSQQVETEIVGEKKEFAIIRLGENYFGLDVLNIRDIRPLGLITRVPRVPNWVAGVINLRGRIISAMLLDRFLGLPEVEDSLTSEKQIITIESENMELALIVDEVRSIEMVLVQDILETKDPFRGISQQLVQGVVVLSGQKFEAESVNEHNNMDQTNGVGSKNVLMVTILAINSLLADKRLIVHDEI